MLVDVISICYNIVNLLWEVPLDTPHSQER